MFNLNNLTMNRLLYLLGVLILSVTSYAQVEPIEHFTFKGVPIDGTLAEFGQKLTATGLTINQKTDEVIEFKGNFGGTDDCKVIAFSTPKTGQVYSLMVIFPEVDTWYSLKADYKEYKTMLTSKYGKAQTTVERFSDPYYEGDGYEMQALRLNKVSYASFFHTDNGEVTVALSYMNGAHLVLVYTDKHNDALNESETNAMKYSDL